ncbi:MAG: SDR family NAD(P)-dependent oxidoreductase [Deltaproteobacteria bacterium]|nr:MAG: SDR family NAD(P)-dependent oxidoreductase [Deltaproteobacteria bacterium]
MDFYRGKRVYITGGSSGIGLAAAKTLASWGASVYISARGEERLAQALEEVKSAAVGAHQKFGMVAHDVSDPAACEAAAAQVVAGMGGVDVLIANAGVAHPSRILETPPEVYERMMRINYFGTVHTTRAFLPHMFAQKGGSIGIVSSMLGFMGIYGYTAYAASKFAQVGFADSLRQELIDYGIKLTILYPPDTDTPQLVEENKIKPPETKAISGEVKTMSAEAVAGCLLKGIAKGKYHVVPGTMGSFTRFMNRHAPWVVRWIIDGELKKFRKNNPDTRPA